MSFTLDYMLFRMDKSNGAPSYRLGAFSKVLSPVCRSGMLYAEWDIINALTEI